MISTMLDELLAQAVTALGADAPERQSVEHGEEFDLPHDCEQLLVSLTSYTLEQQRGAPEGGGCAVIPVATFLVELLLCYPYGTPEEPAPDVDEISTAARRIADAGVALVDGLHDANVAGDLFTGRCCDDITIAAPQPVGPDGGLAGWVLTLSVRM